MLLAVKTVKSDWCVSIPFFFVSQNCVGLVLVNLSIVCLFCVVCKVQVVVANG